MDRSLVQAKQSRFCTSDLEQIAFRVAKTASRRSVGLVRACCDIRKPRRMRVLGRRAPHLDGAADPLSVPMALVCLRNFRSAAGTARTRPHIAPPVHRARTSNDTNRSFIR